MGSLINESFGIGVGHDSINMLKIGRLYDNRNLDLG